jgi:glutathione synthase/RimK-type ligase-like ATP-grasp enzyme
MNDKNEFIRLCLERGWVVPPTMCYDRPAQFQGTEDIKFPCYLKVGCSASGAGVFYCQDGSSLESHIDALEADVDFQIQQPVPNAHFLNVQYDVLDGKAHRTIYTEQVLDGFSHAGNRYPSNYGDGPWDLCDPVANYMVEQGMKGPFAFDVAINGEGFVLIECNPRFNGCTYYSRVAEGLQAKTWVARNLSVKAHCLSELSLEGLEWDRSTSKGIVIISWGTVLQGKVGVLFAGNSEKECQDLYVEFLRRNGKDKKV